MIHKARTPEEKKACVEFLRKYGLESPTDCFLFTRSITGAITGVAGVTLGMCDSYKVGYIEPYYCENNMSNLKLYAGCEGMMHGWDCKYIIVGCEENETTEEMFKELGYDRWSKKMNQYIKQLGD